MNPYICYVINNLMILNDMEKRVYAYYQYILLFTFFNIIYTIIYVYYKKENAFYIRHLLAAILSIIVSIVSLYLYARTKNKRLSSGYV